MNLLNLAPDAAAAALWAWAGEEGLEPYRVRQILPRLWQRPVRKWSDCTDLPRDLIERLETVLPLESLELLVKQESRDGTVKFLWKLGDGEAIESVLIPEGRRRTLCISSQAGCALGCRFCATGTMGLRRNLEPWEIVAQVRELLVEPCDAQPTNIVFMGMGEPLHNWSSVDRALTILNDSQGLGIGARRITISTVGLIPGLEKLAARREQFRLAVSLHGATTQVRGSLMPVERKYGLEQLLSALKTFERRITLEYVLIEGVNDGMENAGRLARISSDLGAHINLLPLHPGGDPGLKAASAEALAEFADTVSQAGANITVRRSRGLDIDAACGQLRVSHERQCVASKENGDVDVAGRIQVGTDPPDSKRVTG